MKAIRKLLAMALVVVMVLSMSTFVFAAEEEIQPRTCAHNFMPRQVRRYVRASYYICRYYIDVYEVCSDCGYTYISRGDMKHDEDHFVEEGSDYCVKCCSYGCGVREP